MSDQTSSLTTIVKVSCVYCNSTQVSAPISALLDDAGLIVKHDCHARHSMPTVTGPAFRIQVVSEKGN